MKKFLLLLLAMFLMVPAMCFAGCFGDNSNAKKDGLYIESSYKTEYIYGETLNISGGILNNRKDGKDNYVAITSEMVSGFDTSSVGSKKMILAYDNQSMLVDYTVSYPYEENVKYFSTTSDTSFFASSGYMVMQGKFVKMYSFNKFIFTNKNNIDTNSVLFNTFEINFNYDQNGKFEYYYFEMGMVTVKIYIDSSQSGVFDVMQYNSTTGEPVSLENIKMMKFDTDKLKPLLYDGEYNEFSAPTAFQIDVSEDGRVKAVFRQQNQSGVYENIFSTNHLPINKFKQENSTTYYYTSAFEARLYINSNNKIQYNNSLASANYYLAVSYVDEDYINVRVYKQADNSLFYSANLLVK